MTKACLYQVKTYVQQNTKPNTKKHLAWWFLLLSRIFYHHMRRQQHHETNISYVGVLSIIAKKNMATFIAVSSWRVVQSYTICGAVYDRTPSCTTDWIEEEESFYVFTFIITLRIIITIIMRGCRFLYSQQKRGSSYNI